jgi:hypothetical protein
MTWWLNLRRRVRPTMPIGKNVVKIEEVKIQKVNLAVKEFIEAVPFYLKVNTQRIADPSRYAVTFHIVGGRSTYHLQTDESLSDRSRNHIFFPFPPLF